LFGVGDDLDNLLLADQHRVVGLLGQDLDFFDGHCIRHGSPPATR
jgi:predicted glycoside hydrolase/deacetylase ChbG (UPF0249 family)